MDHMDLVVTCVSQECNRVREMENSNRPINGTITILRGPLSPNRNVRPLTRDELSEIIDYSLKNKTNQEPCAQEDPPSPNPVNQPAAPTSVASAPSVAPMKKRPRYLDMDPMERAIRAEHKRLDELRAKRRDRRNYRLENDEDVAFFNSILPHVRALNARQKMKFRVNILQVLDEGVQENDTSPPGSPVPSQDLCGFYCGNCGQKFMFKR